MAISDLPEIANIIQIIELVTTGQISTQDAVERIGWAEEHPQPAPEGMTCATCRYWRQVADDAERGTCTSPGQPAHVEHQLSERCFRYDRRDLHADALPIQPPMRGKSRMWK